MCLSVFLLGFVLLWALCTSWTWVTIPFPMLGKISTIIFSNIFLGTLFIYFPSGTTIRQKLVYLLFQSSLRLSSFFFFSLFYFAAVIFTILSPAHLSVLFLQVLCCWFFLVCFYFSYCIVYLCLFFSSFRSLLVISCIFLICTSILFFEISDHLCYH